MDWYLTILSKTSQNRTSDLLQNAFSFHLKYIFITKLFQTHQRKQNVIFDGWKNGAIIIKVKVLWVETPQWDELLLWASDKHRNSP